MGKNKNIQVGLTLGLFIVYLLALVWIVIFKMQCSFSTLPHFRGLNLIPFAGSVIKNNQLDYNEVIMNLVVFIPLGLYLSMIKIDWPFWKRLIPIAGVSLLFELFQYLFAIGGSDITDLLSNTLGGVIGMVLYIVFFKMLKEKTHKILNILGLIITISIIFAGILISRVVTYKF